MADRDEIEWIKKNEPWRLKQEKVEETPEAVDEEKEEFPDESWTENEIYDWIKENDLSIKYDIRSKTKKWALNQIKKYSN